MQCLRDSIIIGCAAARLRLPLAACIHCCLCGSRAHVCHARAAYDDDGGIEDDAQSTIESDTASETDASVALEEISLEGDLLDIGQALDEEGGFMGEQRDPFDPNAWAAAEPAPLAPLGQAPSVAASARADSSVIADALSSRLSTRLSGAAPAKPGAAAGASDSDDSSDVGVTEAEARAAATEIDSRAATDTPTAAALAAVTATLAPADSVGGRTASALLDAISQPLGAAPSQLLADGWVSGVAVYGFDAEEESDLTVREGDEVFIWGPIGEGWTHVRLKATDEAGNVPEWAVEAVADGGSSALVPPLDAAVEGQAAAAPPAVAPVYVTGDVPAGGTPTAGPAHTLAPVLEDSPFGLDDLAPPAAAPAAAAAAASAAAPPPPPPAEDDNPFGLIDVSSPDHGGDAAAAVAAVEADAQHSLLGDLADLEVVPPPAPAAAAADGAAAPGALLTAADSLPAAPSLPAAGSAAGVLPVVDNPFGGASTDGAAPAATGAANPFQGASTDGGVGGAAVAAPAAATTRASKPELPAPQFEGSADNPFGGL